MEVLCALVLQRMIMGRWSSVPCSCLTVAATRLEEALLAVQALALSSCSVTGMHWPYDMASKNCQHGDMARALTSNWQIGIK